MENNHDLCRQLLELLLHIKIDHLEKPQSEKYLKEALPAKSVRFDVYSFENVSKEDPSLKLGDGTYKIFFNAKECDKMESAEEKSFFNFIKGSNPDTEFTKQLSEKLLLARCN